MKKIIFVFSLPRSGSTLLQRLLCTHSKIKSTSEPWILLPLVNFPELNPKSQYDSKVSTLAVKEFLANIQSKNEIFDETIRYLISSLYYSLINNGEYFMDKTPRYIFIIDRIVEIFPDAKFIFLFRNPLDIYISIMKTWTNGKFIKSKYLYADIIDGPFLLANGYKKHKDISLKLNYSDLVGNTKLTLKKIYNYLNLNDESNNAHKFSSIKLKGTFGDQIGSKKYSSISTHSIENDLSYFNSIFKKIILSKYLKQVDEDYLKFSNISLDYIIKKVNNTKNHWLGISHLIDYLSSMILRRFMKHSTISEAIKYYIKNKFIK